VLSIMLEAEEGRPIARGDGGSDDSYSTARSQVVRALSGESNRERLFSNGISVSGEVFCNA
jgi:hypothetical protein